MNQNLSTFLIAGPTASGKSGLALALADEIGAWIVNADSLQVYQGWRLLTARPTLRDEKRAPHRLYGHVDPATRYSVGEWLRDLAPVLTAAREQRAPLIIVGGTGLYFRTLLQGLSPIPAIPDASRAATEELLDTIGAEAFRVELISLDPKAATLDIENPRRMLRAREVFDATGKSLVDWQSEVTAPLLYPSEVTAKLVLNPDRDALAARIADRFGLMVAEGALDEVREMHARGLDASLPSMRAIGSGLLAAYQRGEISLDAATERATIETRQYAKRQRTWFRNQMADWPITETPEEALTLLRNGA